MKLSAEMGGITEAVARFVPHPQSEPVRHPELEGVTGELDYPQESIMQRDKEYSLIDSLKGKVHSAMERADSFIDNHPIATGVGVTTALVALGVILDDLSRPDSPQTEPLSV
jgi:hypothetical protein